MAEINNFKGVVGLTEEQYNTLQSTGTLVVGDVTYTYDPTGTVYVTDSLGNTFTIMQDIVVNNWETDTTYTDFGYRAAIKITNLTDNDVCEVTFSQEQAASGNYAQVCNSADGQLYIYAKVNDTITIPTIIIYVNSGQSISSPTTTSNPKYYAYTFSDYETLFNTLWTIYEKNPSAIIKLTSSELVKGTGITYTFDSNTNTIERTTADFNFFGVNYEYYLKLDSVINATSYRAIITSYEFNASTYTVTFTPTSLEILGKRIRDMTGNTMDIIHAELYSENVSTLTPLTFDIFTTADSLPQSTSNITNEGTIVISNPEDVQIPGTTEDTGKIGG